MEDLISGGFLKDVAMWGTAMDISADQAGDWAAKWEQAFHMNHEQIMVLADQINYLGANSATTAAEIAAAVNSAASLGQIGGISVSTTAALADAMLATGVATDRVGTSIKRMVTNFSKGSAATDQQKKLWRELGFTAEGVAKSMQEDSVKTLDSIFKAIKGLPEERQVSALSTLFGQWAIEGGAKIVNNLGVYEKALAMVSDPSLYEGSMKREFAIKSGTSESMDTMTANALRALKIDMGTAFLPARKEISGALVGFINQLRDMPELGEIAQTLASLFSKGVTWAGEALEKALPTIRDALNYLLDHGPQVVSVLKTMAGAFLAMKFAPGIAGLLGSGGSRAAEKGGGLTGMLSGLWKGGRNAPNAIRGKLDGAAGWLDIFKGATKESMGLTGRTGALGFLKTAWSATAGNSGIGRYFGGIANTKIGGGILGGIKTAGSVLGEIFSGISDATGLTGMAKGGLGAVRSAAGWVTGKAGGLAGRVAGSAPGQLIGGALGNAGSFMSAIWGPMASGFGGLLSGALPIVGVISSIIAVVSLLGDHLEDIRGIIGSVFGDAGLAVFDTFIGGLQRVGDFITGLFQDGGVAQAMAPLRDAITGMFGDNAGAAFDGLVQILQSVMGIVGQIVTFANTTVKPIIQEIFGFITQTVVPILLQTFTAAAPVISGIISTIGSAVMTVAQIIGSAIQLVLPIIEGIATAFLKIASVAIPTVLSAFNALANLLKVPVNAVIRIINGIIGGINAISIDIPGWVPGVGGKHIGFSIQKIPLLAKGGFTSGPSIAGEAGTEAVISFQKSARSQNIDTWLRAGKMLGMGNRTAELLELPAGGGGNPRFSITFAPHVEIKGNADREVVDQAMEAAELRFEAWLEANFDRLYDRAMRERSRTAY